MGDLISRSELLKWIPFWGGDIESMIEFIANMESAYDVEMVVGQIHNKFENFVDEIIDNPEHKSNIDFLLKQNKEICEIVRNGGKE
jgi:hypothetical protein